MAKGALSSSFINTYTYDVFLGFRGEDTRYGFTGNLYSALSRRGVFTFIDDDALKKGEEITPSLLNAIKKSRMAIIIFSKNYASSTFCLSELVQILECHTKEKMWIWPVFYCVDPSEVRHQKGNYGEELVKHEQGRFKDDKNKVRKWRSALRQAADLSGWHFKPGGEYEHEFIGKIIEEVSRKLNRPFLHIADYPVGLQARIQDVQSLIGAKFKHNVNVLGIHGIGGIGKSTLARAMYNSIADQYEGSCFLANVREKSTRHGLEHIQETMLFELVGERNIKLGDVNQGIPILKDRLHRKKVLLILDDVDHKKQLEATTGRFDWFGLGSIIIITTRDKHLLDIHGVEKLYEVKKFNEIEALELFRWNALKNKEVHPSYSEILKCAIDYADGLPLVLETIGSNLFGKTLDEWKSALEAYERIPNRNVQEILKVSYDGLEENEKGIFLDIACFFNGCTLRYVTNMLDGCDFKAKYGISVLKEKSLINTIEYDDDIVTMHSLIQSMGKELVRQQSTRTEKRNRLWFHEDVIRVLEKNQENDKIEAMLLDMLGDQEVQWNEVVFGKMENLRMLIKKKGFFLGSPKQLPNSLRVLEWWGYAATSLPSNVHSKNLTILNLSHSCFQWDTPLEKSKVLSRLIFTCCKNIRQIPDVSGFPNLTELCVDDCTNLIEIHDSVGFLDKLLRFSAKGCTKLSIIPKAIKLTSLEFLCLRDCSSLHTFPEILGPMEKIKSVDLEGTAMKNLPPSMQNLEGLQMLHLNRCKKLENNALSNIIQMLPKFHFLGLLELMDSNLTVLPAYIEECCFLEILDLSGSKQLREIRGLPQSVTDFFANNCTSLEAGSSTLNSLLQSRAIGSVGSSSYILPGQSIPEWFDLSCAGNSLCFWFREECPSLVVCAVVGVWDDIGLPFYMSFDFHLKINDNERVIPYRVRPIVNTDHVFIVSDCFLLTNFDSESLLSENEWHHGEVLFQRVELQDSVSGCSGSIKWTGVYVNRTFTRMEDVLFTNPYTSKSTRDDSSFSNRDTLLCEALDMQQDWVLMRPYEEQPLNYEYSNFESFEPAWTNDGVFLDHQAKVQGESSRAPGCFEKQNIQVLSLPSSSGQVGLELHQGTSSTMLPTIVDASLRNQTKLTQDDDVEMEVFYASLDAETHVVSCSHDKLVTTTPSEETKEALKVVLHFISNDASCLLHPECCSVMKTSLEYLSNLSAEDGISTEMRILISETSRKFIHWSRDYSAASVKIESTTYDLQRADELETSLQGNKKKFSDVVALEKELLDKLARMEESKKELEEKINVIQGNISASQSEKNLTHKRKRDVFEEGKMLKTKRDELREREPHLHHELGLAKETQRKIKSEWSEIREKFKKIAAECE